MSYFEQRQPAIDAMGYSRWRASSHYLRRRIEWTVKTVQTTFLVDTAVGAITDLDCIVKCPCGMRIRPKIARHNAGEFRSLRADKGYDAMEFREDLRADGVQPLINQEIT